MAHVTSVHYTIGTVPHLNHSNLFYTLITDGVLARAVLCEFLFSINKVLILISFII